MVGMLNCRSVSFYFFVGADCAISHVFKYAATRRFYRLVLAFVAILSSDSPSSRASSGSTCRV